MTTTATNLEGLFQAGIAAYQKGEYAQAQMALTQLSRCSSQSYRTKAEMGLVRVYMAQKDQTKAKALCKKLSKSSRISVQQWALTTLTKVEAQLASQPPTPADQPQADCSKLSIFHYAYLNGEVETYNAQADQATQVPQAAQALQAPQALQDRQSPKTYEWPNAGRLSKGRPLGKMKRSPIWRAQTFGVIALFALLLYLVHSAIALIHSPLYLLSKVLPSEEGFTPTQYSHLAGQLAIILLVILVACPWLWDGWLQLSANRQAFSSQKLRAISPEAANLLARFCQQHRWPIPTLWKLPTEIPLIFSYGWLPRNARLVMSEGLLSQLTAEEIATLVGYEISHWQTGYWPLLSLQGLLIQLFHQLYWQLSLWGNKQKKQPIIWITGTLANVSYIAFWLLQIPGLWVSRTRTYYGDRIATETTGNPNALARALAKLSFGLAKSVARQGYTPALIESLTLLLPVSTDLTRQSMYGQVPLETLFAWDSLSPLRHWMSVPDKHPPLGDRLRLIMAYAQHWKLDLELPLATPVRKKKALSQADWTNLITQGLPFFGLALGIAVGLTMWLLGAIGTAFQLPALDWMDKDTGLLWACALMGLGVCTLLRINRFFPDLSFAIPFSQALPQSLTDPSLLPVSSLPTKLSGTLIGRPGLANWLGQDLLLKTPEFGLLKLHFFSALGPLGNRISQQEKPFSQLGTSVQILGWFRRGNHPWLDIDQLKLSNGTRLQAAHPIASLILATTTTSLALWLLGFGQIFQEIIIKLK